MLIAKAQEDNCALHSSIAAWCSFTIAPSVFRCIFAHLARSPVVFARVHTILCILTALIVLLLLLTLPSIDYRR